MRKASRKTIRKLLDDAVKDIIKKRDNYTCQHCGKKVEGSDCHGSHVIPVSAGLMLAYEPDNLKVLCYHCHINWWHKNPTEAGQWFRDKFPERMKRLDELKLIPKTTIKDYQLAEKLEELKQVLK